MTKRERKMKKRLYALTLVAALVVLALLVSFVSAATSTFTVEQTSQTQFLLPAGTIFNGSISVSSTLRFWVSAPDGSQIVNLGLIDHSAGFGFVAPQDGNYTMNFENGLPYAPPVQVTFTYTTNPDVTSNNNSSAISPTYIVILVVIGVVGAGLIIFAVRRKKRNTVSKDDEVVSP
jgi:hypothetical protein